MADWQTAQPINQLTDQPTDWLTFFICNHNSQSQVSVTLTNHMKMRQHFLTFKYIVINMVKQKVNPKLKQKQKQMVN